MNECGGGVAMKQKPPRRFVVVYKEWDGGCLSRFWCTFLGSKKLKTKAEAVIELKQKPEGSGFICELVPVAW